MQAIRPYELVTLSWTKKDAPKKAPNVMALIHNFNKVAEFVRTEILLEQNLKRRADRLARVIGILEYMHMLHL